MLDVEAKKIGDFLVRDYFYSNKKGGALLSRPLFFIDQTFFRPGL
jgi:hypothetical protein